MNESLIKLTGIRRIDEDHQQLFTIMRQLIQGRPTRENPDPMVTALRSYVAHHFDREYQLMVRMNYATEEMQKHLLAHARFSDRVAQFAEAVQQEGDGASTELDQMVKTIRAEMGAMDVHHLKPDRQMAAYLLQWLVTHTNSVDQAMVQSMRRDHPQTVFDEFEVEASG
ncbi:MAG: hypothetical protein HQL73_04890 [Magnetococcales bacterium]|nr:hypothetical protein [Magnetococcales bacterium]